MHGGLRPSALSSVLSAACQAVLHERANYCKHLYNICFIGWTQQQEEWKLSSVLHALHALHTPLVISKNLDVIVSSSTQHILWHGPVNSQDFVLMACHVIQGSFWAASTKLWVKTRTSTIHGIHGCELTCGCPTASRRSHKSQKWIAQSEWETRLRQTPKQCERWRCTSQRHHLRTNAFSEGRHNWVKVSLLRAMQV